MNADRLNPSARRSRWADTTLVRWADQMSTALSVSALAVLLMTIVVSVAARYIFAAPLIGSNEVLQMSLVALVTLALLPAAKAELHIRVDVLDQHIGRWGRWGGDLFTRAICAFVLVCLAFRAAGQALEAAEFGDTTNMLAIPLWPVYALMVLGSLLYALMLLVQWVDLLRHGGHKND